MKNLFVICALIFGFVTTLDAAQSKAEAEAERKAAAKVEAEEGREAL